MRHVRCFTVGATADLTEVRFKVSHMFMPKAISLSTNHLVLSVDIGIETRELAILQMNAETRQALASVREGASSFAASSRSGLQTKV